MRAAVAMAVFCGLSCGQPPPPAMCGPLQSSLTSTAFSFGAAGRPLTVELAVPESCPGGVTVTAHFTLADPDNAPVTLDMATVSVVTPDTNGLRAHFTFTPQRAGPYHATAQFEPNLGVAQHDFVVANDHTSEAPAFTVPSSGMLGSCTHLEVTSQGNLLCLHPVPMLFSGDGGLLQGFGDVDTSYEDGTLWLSDGATVSRWLEGTLADGGAGFVQTPELPAMAALPDSLLMALGDSVIWANSDDIGRVGRVDGGLVITGMGLTGITAPEAGWTDGDEVLITGQLNSPCVWSFDAGMQSCISEQMPQLVAADRGGLWSPEEGFAEGAQVQLLTAFTAVQSTNLRVPDDANLDSPNGPLKWETAPSLVSGGLRYVVSLKQGFALDAYDGDAARQCVTGTAVVLESSGALHIYRR